MGFRDDRDAQRLRIEALERELGAVRSELESAVEARDRAVEALEKQREEPPAPRTRFGVGARVYVEWRGTWWDATVVEVVGPSLWKIHYDGWSSRWDEVVAPARIAPRDAPPPGRRAGRGGPTLAVLALLTLVALALAYFGFAGPAPTDDPGSTMPAGSAPGAPVWVEWNGSWYRAVVLEATPGGGARIHYEGYADSFDETVGAERLRAR